jgi:hypothetical protein
MDRWPLRGRATAMLCSFFWCLSMHCLDIEEVSGSFWQFVPVGRLADRHFFDFVGETGSPRFLRLR